MNENENKKENMFGLPENFSMSDIINSDNIKSLGSLAFKGALVYGGVKLGSKALSWATNDKVNLEDHSAMITMAIGALYTVAKMNPDIMKKAVSALGGEPEVKEVAQIENSTAIDKKAVDIEKIVTMQKQFNNEPVPKEIAFDMSQKLDGLDGKLDGLQEKLKSEKTFTPMKPQMKA